MTWLGMTPHFTIRVWGSVGWFKSREPMCDVEVDTTQDVRELTITRHRGLKLTPQKILTRGD